MVTCVSKTLICEPTLFIRDRKALEMVCPSTQLPVAYHWRVSEAFPKKHRSRGWNDSLCQSSHGYANRHPHVMQIYMHLKDTENIKYEESNPQLTGVRCQCYPVVPPCCLGLLVCFYNILITFSVQCVALSMTGRSPV